MRCIKLIVKNVMHGCFECMLAVSLMYVQQALPPSLHGRMGHPSWLYRYMYDHNLYVYVHTISTRAGLFETTIHCLMAV